MLLGFSAQRMISDETSYYLASNYLVILLSLLFFTSLGRPPDRVPLQEIPGGV